jgi:hypothetical protein
MYWNFVAIDGVIKNKWYNDVSPFMKQYGATATFRSFLQSFHMWKLQDQEVVNLHYFQTLYAGKWIHFYSFYLKSLKLK